MNKTIQILINQLLNEVINLEISSQDFQPQDNQKILITKNGHDLLDIATRLDVLQTAINNKVDEFKNVLGHSMDEANKEKINLPDYELLIKRVPASSHQRLDTARIKSEYPEIAQECQMTVYNKGSVKMLYGSEGDE